MTTIARIRAGLFARVPEIIDVSITDGALPIAHIVVPSEASEELKADIERALASVISAGTMVKAEFVLAPVAATPQPEGPHLLASIAGDASVNGIIRTVARLAPEVAQVVVGEWVDGALEIRVGDAHGACSEKVREVASKAIGSVLAPGVPYKVVGVRSTDGAPAQNDFPTAARTNSRLRDIADEDEHRFAQRITKLTTTNAADRVPLIDDLSGEKICTTIGGPDAAGIGTFLPIYDHILLLMVPDSGDAATYYRRHYGLSENAFVAYVRARKVIPIFKFELGRYPEVVWRRFLEDPSLPFVTARDLDYLCARHTWESSAWLRELRADRDVTALMHQALAGNTAPQSSPLRAFKNVLRMVLLGVEAFEGDMWFRGHLGVGQYSPALPLIEAMRELVRNDATKSFGLIEAEGAAMHLSIGQALNAATHEGLVGNENLLLEIARLFGGESSSLYTSTQGSRLVEVLNGLQISFSEQIPPQEYLQIFDEANTKRLRRLVGDLVRRDDRYSELELREVVQTFNVGVDRIDRNAVNRADVSLIASGAGGATGIPGLKTAVETSASITGRFGNFIDSHAGSFLDTVRGWINRVPAQSVRLYRIRHRLGAKPR